MILLRSCYIVCNTMLQQYIASCDELLSALRNWVPQSSQVIFSFRLRKGIVTINSERIATEVLKCKN